ncbi:hypothetical protein D9M68_184930 [compost metagenome]
MYNFATALRDECSNRVAALAMATFVAIDAQGPIPLRKDVEKLLSKLIGLDQRQVAQNRLSNPGQLAKFIMFAHKDLGILLANSERISRRPVRSREMAIDNLSSLVTEPYGCGATQHCLVGRPTT